MQYGRELVCVRYRYDEDRCERLKTVEIVVERVEWYPKKRAAAPEQVRVRILPGEGLLRRAALFAGARWDESSGTWTLQREAAVALGLQSRILRRGPRKRMDRKPKP